MQSTSEISEWASNWNSIDGCHFSSCPDPYDQYSSSVIIEGPVEHAWINGNEHQVSNGVIGPVLHENIVTVYNVDIEPCENQFQQVAGQLADAFNFSTVDTMASLRAIIDAYINFETELPPTDEEF